MSRTILFVQKYPWVSASAAVGLLGLVLTATPAKPPRSLESTDTTAVTSS